MSFLVQPRLVNGPFGDPALYLDFRYSRRAMLFDLGDIAALSPRQILRVTHAFVSHAHMDHVAGLDRLLRLCLHRPGPLSLVGPPGFLLQIEHRLRSYTWNLLDATSADFRLQVAEFDGSWLGPSAEFRARDAFERRAAEAPPHEVGLAHAEATFAVRAVALDHGTPSLAFALREADQVNVWRNGLDTLELEAGPWLNAAKDAARAGLPDAYLVEGPRGRPIPLGLLRAHAFRVSRGRLIAYVPDAADTQPNRDRIAALAADADHLFIEATFLHADRHMANATKHLTAKAAGEIARLCRARQVTPFHHSVRYLDRPEDLENELREAWTGQARPADATARNSARAGP
jgi:ribonuclease Z